MPCCKGNPTLANIYIMANHRRYTVKKKVDSKKVEVQVVAIKNVGGQTKKHLNWCDSWYNSSDPFTSNVVGVMNELAFFPSQKH